MGNVPIKLKFKMLIWPFVFVCLLIALCVTSVFTFRNFYFSNLYVDGESMNPTFKGNINVECDYGIYDKSESALKNLKRFQIVVTYYPGDKSTIKIKRVLFLPGEIISVEKGKLYVYESMDSDVRKELPVNFDRCLPENEDSIRSYGKRQLKDNEYFLSGDNWLNSKDSFGIGPISDDLFVGVVTEMQGTCRIVNNEYVDKKPYAPRYFLGVNY